MRALIVDDSKFIRTLVSKFLDQFSFEVHVACDGRDALRAISEKGPFDLVLVDWNMPNMNGIEFVKHVRSMGISPDMRIVMITTETDTENVRDALEAGVEEYIMKPFDQSMLLEKLALLGIVPAQQ